MQKPKFQKTLSALIAALLQNIFISTMAKNALKSNAKSAQNCLTFIAALLTKQNSGVLIATMPFISGNTARIALFTNVTMINARLSSRIAISLIPSRKLFAKQSLLNSNSVINTANITLPMNNCSIRLQHNQTSSSTSATQ